MLASLYKTKDFWPGQKICQRKPRVCVIWVRGNEVLLYMATAAVRLHTKLAAVMTGISKAKLQWHQPTTVTVWWNGRPIPDYPCQEITLLFTSHQKIQPTKTSEYSATESNQCRNTQHTKVDPITNDDNIPLVDSHYTDMTNATWDQPTCCHILARYTMSCTACLQTFIYI